MTPMIHAGTELNCSIIVMESRGGRAKEVSNIMVKAGNVPVAKAVLGGRFNKGQVLNELRRLPNRFDLCEGYEVCKALNLV